MNALIDAGAEKEAPSKTGPPLLWAAGSGNVTAVKALVESGVNCNAISSDGCGAVLMAAAAGIVILINITNIIIDYLIMLY